MVDFYRNGSISDDESGGVDQVASLSHSPPSAGEGGGDRMGSNGNFSQDPWTRYIPRVETERGDVFQST